MKSYLSKRSVMLAMAGLGIGHALRPEKLAAQTASSRGYVLGPSEGEHLVLRGGNIFIKTDPTKGSAGLAMGTQQVLTGVGIPIHRHFQMDEAFYILEGNGTFILDDVRHSFEKGGAIFIPKNSWHGFENPDGDLLLLWMVTPPGLESFFREVVSAMPKTKEQLNEIAHKYATEFR